MPKRKKGKEGGADQGGGLEGGLGARPGGGLAREWGWLAPLVLFPLLAFLLYAPALNGPFVFDDMQNLRDNTHIQIRQLSWESLREAAFESPLPSRPVANVSFALNYLAGKNNLAGYRLVNVGIHVLAAILLFFILRATLALPVVRMTGSGLFWIPFAASLLWVVHPLATQSVAYIVQRMNSMAAMFYLGGLLSYIQGRRAGTAWASTLLYVLALLCLALSLGSKELAVTFPAAVLLYEWFFFQDMDRRWVGRGALGLLALAVLAAVLSFWYLGSNPLEALQKGYAARDFTMAERVMTQFRVVWLYASLILLPLPSRMNVDYDFPVSHSLFSPLTTFPAMAAVIALACLAMVMARRRRVEAFCILWFLGTLVVESSVVGLELVYEHRTYLPSAMLVFGIVYVAWRALPNKAVLAALLCLTLLLYSFGTWQRASLWGAPLALWEDCLKKSPNKARVHCNYALALRQAGDTGGAIVHYRRAMELQPNYLPLYYNWGAMMVEDGQYEQGLELLKTAMPYPMFHARACLNSGVAYMNLGQLEKARELFLEALKDRPDYVQARANLALVQARMGDLPGAALSLKKMLEEDPGDFRTCFNLGKLYMNLEQYEDASRYFQKALEIKPGLRPALEELDQIRKLEKQGF